MHQHATSTGANISIWLLGIETQVPQTVILHQRQPRDDVSANRISFTFYDDTHMNIVSAVFIDDLRILPIEGRDSSV